MKILLLITLMTIFSSCNKEEQEPLCCVNIDITWGVYLRNLSGEDLLNPNTLGYYNHSNISQYLISNGEKKILNSGNNMISNPEPNAGYKDYSVIISELGVKVVNTPYPVYESFLELDSNTTDTLKVETLEENNSQTLRKIWYNGEIIWKVDGSNKLPLTIVK